jgi:cytochrome c peroxidase
MQRSNTLITALVIGVVPLAFAAESLAQTGGIPNLQPFPNPQGAASSFSTQGRIDTANPFFRSLGRNGRACVTCHDPSAGFSITPEFVRRKFDESGGLHPLFRTNDGSNSPHVDTSTVDARRRAYSMLLNRAVIRVGLPIPANADYELIDVQDPYGFAGAAELSLFRRPLPSTNARFLSTVMWDGRENVLNPTTPDQTIALNLRAALQNQANNATLGHAEATAPLTLDQRRAIAEFEIALSTAQATVNNAGSVTDVGARGGALLLSQQPFFLGVNDPFGHNPTGQSFNPNAFTLFGAWRTSTNLKRQAIARGERLFNSRPIDIDRVGGLNDVLRVPVFRGACTTCHNTPNVGNHSSIAPLDLGLTDPQRRTPDMPLYTLREKLTGRIRATTDPGRALISGRFRDIGRFKGPVLRGLSARAPYFHDGSARTIPDVVRFYDGRFRMGLNPQERDDLIAFLSAL